MARLTFEQWKSQVDNHIATMTGGFSGDDLPDWGYRDAYDNYLPPLTAAKRVVKAAKDF